MKESYCSYEVSKLLKEKGFDWECTSHFDSSHMECSNTPMNFNSGKYWVSRPTHQMACAWLRDVHDVFILIGWKPIHEEYFTRIYDMTNGYPKRNIHEYTDYNEAIEEAIKYVLESLI